MTNERFNRLELQNSHCPRGRGTFCDGTPNVTIKANRAMGVCRFYKDGKCVHEIDNERKKKR